MSCFSPHLAAASCVCVCVCAEPTAVLHKKTHPPAPRKPIWTKYPIRGGRVWSAGSYAACAASCILSCAGVCLERGGDYLQGQTGTRVMRPSSSAVDHPAKSIRPGSQCMCRLLGLSQLQESGMKFCCSPPTEGSVASCVAVYVCHACHAQSKLARAPYTHSPLQLFHGAEIARGPCISAPTQPALRGVCPGPMCSLMGEWEMGCGPTLCASSLKLGVQCVCVCVAGCMCSMHQSGIG